jgi:tetratricopeptide (TPR) repeat protein
MTPAAYRGFVNSGRMIKTMDGLYIPDTLDLITLLVIPVTLVAIGAVVTQLVKNEIKFKVASKRILLIFVISTLILFGWYNLGGLILYTNGRSAEGVDGCDQAVSIYEQAIHLNPKLSDARTRFVACKIALGLPADALTVITPLRKNLEYSPFYWKDMVSLYKEVNDFDKMLDAVKRAVLLDPSNVTWAVNMGEAYHRAQDYVKAEAVLRNVRVYNGNEPMAAYWLAWALYEQGKYQDALGHFDICITLMTPINQSNTGRCLAGKGFTFEKMGNNTEAVQAFTQALSTNPDQDDVKQELEKLQSH